MSNRASAMLHVNRDLGDITIETLAGELSRLPGVRRAQTGAGTASHHLILVEYDPEAIHANELLEHFTSQGFEAHLTPG